MRSKVSITTNKQTSYNSRPEIISLLPAVHLAPVQYDHRSSCRDVGPQQVLSQPNPKSISEQRTDVAAPANGRKPTNLHHLWRRWQPPLELQEKAWLLSVVLIRA
jgi:hypothetical protein